MDSRSTYAKPHIPVFVVLKFCLFVQTPYYWPSQNHTADTTDYAIYLTKRLFRNKQKHGLEDYELETYAKLKKGLQHKWDFVTMQAEEQVRIFLLSLYVRADHYFM